MPGETAGKHDKASRRRMPRDKALFATAAIATIMSAGTTDGRSADVEFGRYLASECITCHGTAKADSTIPNIFGLGELHFVGIIKAYRDRALPNPVMQNIAGRLRDEEIEALAAYFATAKKP